MTTTHDLPTVAGWWRGDDIDAPRARPRSRRAKSAASARQDARALWRAFTDAGAPTATPPPADDSRRRRRCGARLRRAVAGAADAGRRSRTCWASPSSPTCRARSTSIPTGAAASTAGGRGLFAAPAVQRARLASSRDAAHDAARHAAAAVPQGLHLRRRRGAGALFRARSASAISMPRRSPTARPGSLHGYDVIDPTQVNPELGGEAGAAALVAALRRRGPRPDRRHRAQPHGGRHRQCLVGRRAAPRPRQPLRPLLRHRLGRPATRSCCRSSASRCERRWRRARSRCEQEIAALLLASPAAGARQRGSLATCWNASTIASPGGAAPATASTGGASSTSTSSSACAWRTTRRSRPCTR